MVSEDKTNEQLMSLSPALLRRLNRNTNNKITELARSGRIIHQVLLTKSIINNRQDYLGNHIIDIYNFHDPWNNEPIAEEYKELHLKDFYLSRKETNAFSKKERRALSILHELLAGNKIVGKKGLMSISYDADTEIFRLNVVTNTESLSLQLMEAIFEELREFYIERTIGQPQQTYEMLESQVDSLNNELNIIESRIVRESDRNRGILSSFPGITIDKLRREFNRVSQEYNTAYTTKKNIELLLSQETPEFQIIDQTFFPIRKATSRIRALILGGFIGGLLSCSFLIFRKIVRDALAE